MKKIILLLMALACSNVYAMEEDSDTMSNFAYRTKHAGVCQSVFSLSDYKKSGALEDTNELAIAIFEMGIHFAIDYGVDNNSWIVDEYFDKYGCPRNIDHMNTIRNQVPSEHPLYTKIITMNFAGLCEVIKYLDENHKTVAKKFKEIELKRLGFTDYDLVKTCIHAEFVYLINRE